MKTASPRGSRNTGLRVGLPKGKANFSVTLGKFGATPWVRLGNWTFNSSRGTVNGTFWTWSSADKFDVQVLNTHRCTFDGKTKMCTAYTPYGWIKPEGKHENWGGKYNYVASSGRLDIEWTSGRGKGHMETWVVSLP